MRAPSFRCTEESDGSLILHYYSERPGLEHIVIGIVKVRTIQLPFILKTHLIISRSEKSIHHSQNSKWIIPICFFSFSFLISFISLFIIIDDVAVNVHQILCKQSRLHQSCMVLMLTSKLLNERGNHCTILIQHLLKRVRPIMKQQQQQQHRYRVPNYNNNSSNVHRISNR